MNRVDLFGRLGRDPELRYTQNQTPVATLNLATTDREKVSGEFQDVTEWHRVVVWGKRAETAAQHLKKGASVAVEGKLKTRSWEDQSGKKNYATEIICMKLEYGDKPPTDNTAPTQSKPSNNPQTANQSLPELDDIPF